MFNHEQLKVYFRDEIVDFAEANISIANTGFMYGLGVFTGIRAHLNQKSKALYLFRPQDHFQRFFNGCKACRFENFLKTYDYNRFLEILTSLIKENSIQEDCYIRVNCFADENKISPKFMDYRDSVCAFLYPIGAYVPTDGMRCVVSSWNRLDDNSIPARAKLNGAYINTALAKTEALMHGYDEAIFLDSSGHVVEGSAENLFVVRQGSLITPPVSDNILEGITRKSVIEIAANEGFEVIERSIDRTELYYADEVFLTGTAAQVSPVVEIDKIAVGNGEIGPLSTRIQACYFDAVRGDREDYVHWLVQVD
jgi:branched-chain amino acid aminotransferase